MTGQSKVVVIALGNRFRGDDGIGPSVADSLKERIPGCSIVEGRDDPMAILCAWDGAPLAVVVDAAVSGASPGTIHRFEIDKKPLPRDLAHCSSHGLGLAEAVELGRTLGRLPARLVIYAVEAKSLESGAALSREAVAAAREVTRNVEAEIASFKKGMNESHHA